MNSENFEIDDDVAIKNKATDNVAAESFSMDKDNIIERADYSSIDELLSIDSFITEDRHDVEIDIDSTVSSFLDVNHTLFGNQNVIAPIVDNFQKENVIDFNELISPENINIVTAGENSRSLAGTDRVDDTENEWDNFSALGPEIPLAAKESNSSAETGKEIDGLHPENSGTESGTNSTCANADATTASNLASGSHLKAIENSKNGAASKVTKVYKNKHFPQFINLFCTRCGESPWNSKYYTDPKCPKCESHAWLRCSKCKLEADRYENMVYHLKTKCAPNSVKYKCSKCDYETFLRSSYKYHVKTHEPPPNNIACSDCGVSVKTDKGLRDHKRYYCPKRKIDRQFRCASCYKGYTNEKHLQNHEKNCYYAQGHKRPRISETSSDD